MSITELIERLRGEHLDCNCAAEFGITISTVQRIVNGDRYANRIEKGEVK